MSSASSTKTTARACPRFRRSGRRPGQLASALNRNRCRDGSVLHCRWFNAYLVSDSFTGFVSLAEDVTETTLAREAASASEERLRALFEATPDALTFFDTSGKITDSNPASERLMGVSRAELIAHPFSRFRHPAGAGVRGRTVRARLAGRDGLRPS